MFNFGKITLFTMMAICFINECDVCMCVCMRVCVCVRVRAWYARMFAIPIDFLSFKGKAALP